MTRVDFPSIVKKPSVRVKLENLVLRPHSVWRGRGRYEFENKFKDICFNERCLKDNDVVSLKNLLMSNLWLMNVRPHVSETFSQSIFDSPSIFVGKPKSRLERTRVLRVAGEIFITLQLTEGIRLFFQESWINNPFTNVVSIDYIYIYNVKKKLWFDFVDNFSCRIKQWMCVVILDLF